MGKPGKSAVALRNTLTGHRAEEIDGSKKGGVTELDSDTQPFDGAEVLWTKNILGAPVWDKDKKQYVGFFDMRDILSAVLASIRAYQEQEEVDKEDYDDESSRRSLMRRYNSIMMKNLSSIDSEDNKDSIKDEFSISYLATRNPWCCVQLGTTLEELSRTLCENRAHRIPVVDGDGGRCVGIVSQSALVRFISDHVSVEQLDETLDEAGMTYRKTVISVRDDAPAFEAFDLLDKNRLSGIAVVDEEGKLVGNTSARDIKMAVMDEGRTAMDQDTLSYLAAVRQATACKNERYPSCHVHDNSTVAHVVKLLAKTGYHRVFVVDDDVRPVGVISVADVIRFAMQG